LDAETEATEEPPFPPPQAVDNAVNSVAMKAAACGIRLAFI
jgi:hypothetical protein